MNEINIGELSLDNELELNELSLDNELELRELEVSNELPTQNHNLLYNRDIANQHPISAITNLQSTLDTKLNKDNIIAGANITLVKEGNNITISGEDSDASVKDVKVDGSTVVDANKVANIDLTGKVDKVEGKGLSTNDYTTEDKSKLAGIEAGANKTTKTSQLTNDSDYITTSYHDNTKVDKINGKGLSTNDYTTEEKTKLAGLSNYDDTQIRGLINQKQDTLVSGTNIKTINNQNILGNGNIEIQGGGLDQQIDMKKLLIDTTERTTTDTDILNALKRLDTEKPTLFTNFFKKPEYDTDVDYTTTTMQSIVYWNGTNYTQEITVFNYRNYKITIDSLSGASEFTTAFADMVGQQISQNAEKVFTKTFETKPYNLSDSYEMIINIHWTKSGTQFTNSATFTYGGYTENLLNNYAFSSKKLEASASRDGKVVLWADTGDSSKFAYVEFTKDNSNNVSNVKYYIRDDSETDMARINMCKFTFKYKKRISTSQLGKKIAGMLMRADSNKQVLLYNFRLISEEYPSTNTCILSTISESGNIRTLSGVTTVNNVSYTIYLKVNSSNIQEYRIVTNGLAEIPMEGLTITNTKQTAHSGALYSSTIQPLFGAYENYREIDNEFVGIPLEIYGFKFIDSTDSGNNFAMLQYNSTEQTITDDYYSEQIQFNGSYQRTTGTNDGLYNIELIVRRSENLKLERDSSIDSGKFKGWRKTVEGGEDIVLYTYNITKPNAGNNIYRGTTTTTGCGVVVDYDDGTMTCSIGELDYKYYQKGGGSGVTDVQLDGTTIVSSGVANIPKMASGTLGVAKVAPSTYGININANGNLMCEEATVSQYLSKGKNYAIGKGTLENAIAKILTKVPNYNANTTQVLQNDSGTIHWVDV